MPYADSIVNAAKHEFIILAFIMSGAYKNSWLQKQPVEGTRPRFHNYQDILQIICQGGCSFPALPTGPEIRMETEGERGTGTPLSRLCGGLGGGAFHGSGC